MKEIFLVVLVLTASCSSGDPVEPVRPVKERRQSLPEKCAPFYRDGTDNWINCMGVGLK